MKVKQFLEALNEQIKLDEKILEKEINFYDYKTNIAYNTPSITTVVDWSDEKYLDIVFNYKPEA